MNRDDSQRHYDAFIEWAEEHCPDGLTETEQWELFHATQRSRHDF